MAFYKIRQNSTLLALYNDTGDYMEKILLNVIIILFPILMYLVFSCYSVMNNKKLNRVIFIITMCTSLYFSLEFNNYYDYTNLMLIFCNIPILICYFKKESFFGVILSLIVVLFSSYKYDINVLVISLKYFFYFISYLLLFRRKDFKYLFFKIGGIIQGFFISFEYYMNSSTGVSGIVDLFIYTIIIYGITFFCLYLFKLADKVTNLYLMMNQVNEEKKLKNSLFKLTHEIKNPIAVCKGYLDMINVDNKDKAVKYLGIIRGEIDRSLNVISDFMDYSKIKINKELIDMNILLEEIYDSFELLLGNKNIKFRYNNSYEEIYLFGDYGRLKQVFVNVIKNSIESIKKDGIIDVDVLVVGKVLKIMVSDNGVGMDKEELERVYEMFYTTKRDGTGLGVALSHEIILAHNGMMEYDSIKDVGTKCIISLPM